MRFGNVIWWKCVTGIVSFALSSQAFAGADLRIGGSYRSYPLSGVVEPTLGYGLVLYGTEGSPFSGYIRSAIDGYTAGTYNSGVAKLEIFPLAILGARAGGESIQNDQDYSAFDCANFGCQGRYYRTFVESEMTLGYGPIFVQGKWRRERWSQPKSQTGDFVEPTSGLLMSATGETQTVLNGLAGWKLGENWSVIAGLRYASGETGVSQLPFGMVRYRSGGVTIGVGGGSFKSELKSREATAIAFMTWDIFPSVALK